MSSKVNAYEILVLVIYAGLFVSPSPTVCSKSRPFGSPTQKVTANLTVTEKPPLPSPSNLSASDDTNTSNGSGTSNNKVTDNLTATEKPPLPSSSNLSASDDTNTSNSNEKSNSKTCSAKLCGTLCPGSYHKCDKTETACVCASSTKTKKPAKTCNLEESRKPEKWPPSVTLSPCYLTCKRVYEEIKSYSYYPYIYICNEAISTDNSNYCLCYFVDKRFHWTP